MGIELNFADSLSFALATLAISMVCLSQLAKFSFRSRAKTVVVCAFESILGLAYTYTSMPRFSMRYGHRPWRRSLMAEGLAANAGRLKLTRRSQSENLQPVRSSLKLYREGNIFS